METLVNNIARQIKQDVININAGETENYTTFKNGDMGKHYILMLAGGYAVIYNPQYDRIIVAWCLKTKWTNLDDILHGSWGNGYYFDCKHEHGAIDYNNLYDWEAIAELFIEKALRG